MSPCDSFWGVCDNQKFDCQSRLHQKIGIKKRVMLPGPSYSLKKDFNDARANAAIFLVLHYNSHMQLVW